MIYPRKVRSEKANHQQTNKQPNIKKVNSAPYDPTGMFAPELGEKVYFGIDLRKVKACQFVKFYILKSYLKIIFLFCNGVKIL